MILLQCLLSAMVRWPDSAGVPAIRETGAAVLPDSEAVAAIRETGFAVLPTAAVPRAVVDAARAAVGDRLSELLVAVGPTYVARLWCVLEVWAFFTMGGRLDDVELVALDASGAGGLSRGAIGDGLRGFDAANAACHDPDDRERLLAIVEAGGGVAHLNELVRRLADVPEFAVAP